MLVRPARMLPAMTAHVEVANLSLTGRCRLALTLAPDQAPGVKEFTVSFTQAPAIDFDFVPFGLPIGELPYVLDLLKVGADNRTSHLQDECADPGALNIRMTPLKVTQLCCPLLKHADVNFLLPITAQSLLAYYRGYCSELKIALNRTSYKRS